MQNSKTVSVVLVQTSLLCGCGAADFSAAGVCRRCQRRARLSRENFDGLREFVLQRDGHQCQICGEMDERLVLVHHRRPADKLEKRGAIPSAERSKRSRQLVTVCRACHVRVHFTSRPGLAFVSVALLRLLWRQANPALPEQRLLLGMLADDGQEWVQTSLLDGAPVLSL